MSETTVTINGPVGKIEADAQALEHIRVMLTGILSLLTAIHEILRDGTIDVTTESDRSNRW